MLAETRIGPIISSDGSVNPFRADRTGAGVVTDAHGRLYEACRLGRLFSTGMTSTSVSGAAFTTSTLGATCTPIIGLWNPVNSGKNAVILQAVLNAFITAATSTGPGGFMWATAVSQSAISTGITPFNRLSLAASGSVCKGYAATLLTGLSGNLTVQHASALSGGPIGNFSMVGTAAGFITSSAVASVENFDGSLIIPPGGVLALLCLTTAVAVSAGSALLWEETDL